MQEEKTMFSSDKERIIKQAIKEGKISLDLGGHFRSGKGISKDTFEFIYQELEMRIYKDIDALYDAYISGVDSLEFNKIVELSPIFSKCWDCSERVVLVSLGQSLIAKKDCPYSEGRPDTVFELNVPSGRMIVANDLRTLFPIMGDYNINESIGLELTALAYAKVGMAHCYVGNTCPGVFRNSDEKFVIGVRWDESKKKNPSWPGMRSRRVGGIGTDLWWYSICDADEFARRGGVKDRDIDEVKCRPGVYEFRHVYHKLDHSNWRSTQVYTYIQWVREPDPIVDYAAPYNSLNLSAGQIVLDSIKRWPTLFGDGEEPIENIQRAVDHMMCTIGNGEEYHPNGFWANSPDLTNDSPDIEIPQFDQKFYWYPSICSYSVIARIAEVCEENYAREPAPVVNDSFIALAFNVCRSILLYGDASDREEDNVKFIRKCMQGLKKRYPDKIPENCRNVD